LIDWEIASIDFRTEGLLMAPAFAIPRLLARHRLRYSDITLWEIHEAFSAQVLFHIKALESADFVRHKSGVDAALGSFPRGGVNPEPGGQGIVERPTGPLRRGQHLHRRRPGWSGAPAIVRSGGTKRLDGRETGAHALLQESALGLIAREAKRRLEVSAGDPG